MQNEAGVQLGMLPILKARGKSCMKLPDGSYSGHTLNRMCVSCREHTEKDDPSVTCCLYHVLSNEPDFKSQKSWLSETVEKYPGCRLIFYPKFHCELNFIEMVWAWAKAHHRSTCTYKYNDLKTGLPVTFDELMPISFVRKAFDHCLRFMHGYRSGLVGPVLEYICCEKIQEPSSPLSCYKFDEVANEFAEKKAKKMTFKHCK